MFMIKETVLLDDTNFIDVVINNSEVWTQWMRRVEGSLNDYYIVDRLPGNDIKSMKEIYESSKQKEEPTEEQQPDV